ncbi:MAG TPA: GNAT family N-acetyltransferase [Actinomycetota bacterium]|nr:GNAT family N-acetyltransferase [Actinomycetota bacterium]
MRLRAVTLGDLWLYERLRCDPVMTSELGGPQQHEDMPAKLSDDVAAVERDESWISVVETDDGAVTGSVCIWQHEEQGERISEIGWMVLPEFQGRGLGRDATTAILERARADGRWGAIHAFPAVTNGPSNAICRSLGFTLLETTDFDYNGASLHTNHWRLDPTGGSDFAD